MTSREMAYQYRLAKWSELAKERIELGMSIRAYCAMKDFAENTYFYWQRRLREAARSHLEADSADLPTPGFTKEALVAAPAVSTAEAQTGQLQVQIHDIHLNVDGSYPPEKLAALLRELSGSC